MWNIAYFAKPVHAVVTDWQRKRFLADVSELLALLKGVGESGWNGPFEQVRWLLDHGQIATASEITLAQFGGMGSFNDLVLCVQNGHQGGGKSLRKADQRLSSLRTRLYKHAKRHRAQSR